MDLLIYPFFEIRCFENLRHSLAVRPVENHRFYVYGVVAQELCPARRHHDGVDDDVLCAVLAQLRGDELDEPRRGDHAYLDRVGIDVGEHGVYLLGQELGGGLHDVCDAGPVSYTHLDVYKRQGCSPRSGPR